MLGGLQIDCRHTGVHIGCAVRHFLTRLGAGRVQRLHNRDGHAMNQIAARSDHDLPVMRMPWRWMLAVGVVTFGVIQVGYWIAHAHRPVVSGICAEWDADAKHGLAPLMHQPKLIDHRLLDALTTVRRARHNCAAGRLDLARRDYEAVRALYVPQMSAGAPD
jgi:hypothetical protein